MILFWSHLWIIFGSTFSDFIIFFCNIYICQEIKQSEKDVPDENFEKQKIKSKALKYGYNSLLASLFAVL